MKLQSNKIRRLLLVAILMISWSSLFAQYENYTWIFGYGAGIQFDPQTNMPQNFDNNGNGIYTRSGEGCASISDANGDLLFYAQVREGNISTCDSRIDLRKANNDIICTDIVGHSSSTQGVAILPQPGNPNYYFVLTVYEAPNGCPNKYGLWSTEVEFLGNNNFQVHNKNTRIHPDPAEKMAIGKHADGNGYWIVTKRTSGLFYIYSLDENGLSYHDYYNPQNGSGGLNGYLKFSPNCRKLASASYEKSTVEFYDFDPVTGSIISGSLTETVNNVGYDEIYGVEFSPNGKYVYVTDYCSTIMWYIDFNIKNYQGKYLFNQVPNFTETRNLGALQLGPDEKIYVAREDGIHLGVINNPDDPLNANYNMQGGPDMSPQNCKKGLPNFSSCLCVTVCDGPLMGTSVSHDTTDIIEEGQSIKFTKDCGYIGAVNTKDQITRLSQMELLKLDQSGVVQWNKRYDVGDNFEGKLLNVEQTNDEGYVSCGWINNPDMSDNNRDYFILKTDAGGTPMWSRYSNQPRDEEFQDIEQTSDGGYVAVGYTNILWTTSPVVVKLDANGDLEWCRTYLEYGSYYGGYARSVDLIDANGDGIEEGFAITGYFDDISGNNERDVLVMRINPDGTVNWVKILNLPGNQEGRSIIQFSPGKYGLTGYTNYFDQSGGYIASLFLLEIEENTGLANFHEITTAGMDDGYAIGKLDNANYIIAGETSDFSSQNKDALLLNISTGGGVNWSHIYGGSDPQHSDWARSVDISQDKYQITFIGSTTNLISPDSDQDYYIVSTNRNGFVDCQDRDIATTTINIPIELSSKNFGHVDLDIEEITVTESDPPYLQAYCLDYSVPKKAIQDEKLLFEQSLDGKLKVYPVPLGSDRQLKFDYTSIEDVKIKVRLYNLLGSMILEESFEANKGFNTYGLDLNGQSAGTYFLKVSCGGKDYTTKILIME